MVLLRLNNQVSQRPCISLKRFAIGFAVDELAYTAAFDKVRVGHDSQVMGNGGGCHSAQRDNLSAVHFIARRNGFEDEKAGFVRECLGDTFDCFPVHR